MSKAILILDKMPESCLECEILDNDELTCLGMKVEYGHLNNRQHFCPLKPMPERKEVRKVKYINDVVNIQTTYDYITNKIHGQVIYDVDRIFAVGYNACIDEILGGNKNA